MADVKEFDLIGLEEKTDDELYQIARRIDEWRAEVANRSDYVAYKTAQGLKDIVRQEFKKRRVLWP